MINVSGYKIENKVYRNSKYAYYRAQMEETGENVIIKAPASDHPGLKDIARLNHEYELLKNLKISGVIQPKVGVQLKDGFALVLKAFDTRPLTEILKREGFEVVEALHIVLSLVDTLEKLHKHDIIHKDIQPENIFILQILRIWPIQTTE